MQTVQPRRCSIERIALTASPQFMEIPPHVTFPLYVMFGIDAQMRSIILFQRIPLAEAIPVGTVLCKRASALLGHNDVQFLCDGVRKETVIEHMLYV